MDNMSLPSNLPHRDLKALNWQNLGVAASHEGTESRSEKSRVPVHREVVRDPPKRKKLCFGFGWFQKGLFVDNCRIKLSAAYF